MPETIPAIILAAGKISQKLSDATGAPCRGLLEISGRPMIDAVLAATEEAERIDDITVVCSAHSALLEYVSDDNTVAACKDTFLDTITTGMKTLGNPQRALLLTADLPLLTADALDDFIDRALQSTASVIYPIIGRDDCERAMPGGDRTYVKLADGVFTGGNAAVVTGQFIDTQGQRIQKTFLARKSPIRMAAILGWGFVFRLLLGILTLEQVKQRATSILGAPAEVVHSKYPEIAIDVDKPSDVEDVRRALSP